VPRGPPRLLVAIGPDLDPGPAIATALPDVPWSLLPDTPPAARGEVVAMLAGSRRHLEGFDAATTPKLAFVQRIFTGVDDFPFDRFPAPIAVAGNVGAYAPYVAEQALALALAAARQIVPVQAMVRAGRLRPPPTQRLFAGATAVILGYGAIGRAIADRLRGFDVTVVGVNRTGQMAPGVVSMYPADRLDEALAVGDLVFDARPLTRSTRGSIGRAQLERMRPRAIYVNVGRAATADEEALYRHLESHLEFRAGTDPWWGEDFVHGTFHTRFPFWELPNFVATPHSAGYGAGTIDRALTFALRNLARYFATGDPEHLVDRRDYAADLPTPASAPPPAADGSGGDTSRAAARTA